MQTWDLLTRSPKGHGTQLTIKACRPLFLWLGETVKKYLKLGELLLYVSYVEVKVSILKQSELKVV